MSEKNNTIAQLEAMLFAAGDPVEPEKLADVLKLDIENVIKMLGYWRPNTTRAAADCG